MRGSKMDRKHRCMWHLKLGMRPGTWAIRGEEGRRRVILRPIRRADAQKLEAL